MKRHLSRFVIVFAAISLLLTGIFSRSPRRVYADGPIKIISTSTESKFRHSFTFHAKASSSAGKITSAHVIFRELGVDANYAYKVKDFTPASEVDLEYVWDTRYETTPPWQIMIYSWEVQDDAGNTLRTDSAQAEIKDDTRKWQTLTDGKVTVFWYDKSQGYGKGILQAAQTGFAHVSKATGYTPDQELRVVIYNSQEDFCSFWATGDCLAWYGGITLSAITLQWAKNTAYDQGWLARQAIPHELSHAFLQYWLGDTSRYIPSWLNEGQAVNNQIDGVDDELANAIDVAQAGKWVRFAEMGIVNEVQNDPNDPNFTKVRDWYSQATSMVNYLYTKFGLEVLGKIISKVRNGKSFDASFTEATGLTMDQFELAWLKWVGVKKIPPTFVPTPTDDFSFPPTPTYEPTPSS